MQKQNNSWMQKILTALKYRMKYNNDHVIHTISSQVMLKTCKQSSSRLLQIKTSLLNADEKVLHWSQVCRKWTTSIWLSPFKGAVVLNPKHRWPQKHKRKARSKGTRNKMKSSFCTDDQLIVILIMTNGWLVVNRSSKTKE